MKTTTKQRRAAVFLLAAVLGLLPLDYPRHFQAATASETENITEPVEWNDTGSPVVIDNTEYIFESDLTINEGLEVELKNGSRIIVLGDLKINGTPENPVVFRGVEEGELNFSISAVGEKTEVRGAVFEGGGGNRCSAMKNDGFFAVAKAEGECVPSAALNISSDEARVTDSIFRENYRAVNVLTDGEVTLFNNTFLHSRDVAIYSRSDNEVSAAYNCWMRPSGPSHENNPSGKGEIITGNFNYINWQECGSDFKPVVIIPGIGGSWSWYTMLDEQQSEGWNFSPGVYNYENLLSSFRDRGYEENRDFFIAFYDWRRDNQESMEQYLKPVLERVRATSFDKSFDIVAHSMGGFVALEYLYDENYPGDIDKVVLEGTPLLGSSKVYPVWEGGILPDDWSVLDTYIFYKRVVNDTDNYDIIHEYVPAVSQLLPLYDYVVKNETGEMMIADQMEEKNNYLYGLFDRMVENQDQFPFENIVMLEGTGVDTSRAVKVDSYAGENSDKLWRDGVPNPYPLEKEVPQGDGTVLNESSGSLPFIATKQVENAEHGDLPTLALNEMSDFLGIERPQKEYQLASKDLLLMAFACPVDIKVIAPDGSYITKGDSTILGAKYHSDGKDDGYKIIEIVGPLKGDYKVEIIGTGDGHYDGLVHKTDGTQSDSREISGEITKNETISYDMKLESQSVEIQPVENEDNAAPVVVINSPKEGKSYLNDETLAIDYSVVDDKSSQENITSQLLYDNDALEERKIDLSLQPLGSHSIKVVAIDEAGNEGATENNFQTVSSWAAIKNNVKHYRNLGLIKNKAEAHYLTKRIEYIERWQKELDRLESRRGLPKKIKKMMAEVYQQLIDNAVSRLIRHIEKRKGKWIDAKAADRLVESLQYCEREARDEN